MVMHLFPFQCLIPKMFSSLSRRVQILFDIHTGDGTEFCNFTTFWSHIVYQLKSRPMVPSCAHIVKVWYVVILDMELIWVFLVHNSNWRHMGSLMSAWRLREIHILMTITQMRMWGLLLALYVLSDPLQTSSFVQNVVYKEQLFLIDVACI